MADLVEVLFTLHGKVKEALPAVIVKLNEPLAEDMQTPGKRFADLEVREPDDGYPQPLIGGTWIHRRILVLVISLEEGNDEHRTRELRAMVAAVEAKVLEDPRLGGLLTTVDMHPPQYEHVQRPGTEALGLALFGMVIEYQNTSSVE